jgi:hypothetical protein
VRSPRLRLAILGALTFTQLAHAEDDPCVEAYDSSQRHRKNGELVSAREKLLVCAQPSCPGPVSKECTQWLREVNDALPSVVFGARDSKGNDVTDVRVLEGDRVLSERIDGRELTIDPGPHDFRFEFSDKRRLERRVVIRQAEKNRLIEIVEPARTEAAPPHQDRPVAKVKAGPPLISIVLASVGVVALGSFAYFAIDANTDLDDLQGCKPTCDQADVDTAHRKALIADISLGVGALSFGAAGYFWLTSPAPPRSGAARGLWISGRF